MPGYTYVAVNEKGKEKRGRMDAENRDAVSQQLKKDGLFPVEIRRPDRLVLGRFLDLRKPELRQWYLRWSVHQGYDC